jgi:hypothetical protein
MSKHFENEKHQAETVTPIEIGKQDYQELSDEALNAVVGGKTLAELFREEDWQPVPGARMNEYGKKPLHMMSSIPEETPRSGGTVKRILGSVASIFKR